MQPEIQNSYKKIAQLPALVKTLCARLDIPIRPRTDLALMLDLCTNIDTKIESMGGDELLKVCHAQRVLLAIMTCADEVEIKEPLQRISEKPLCQLSQTDSAGKSALFELEFLQYVRHRGLIARLSEPDIVVKAPFGDYFIACKSIYSLKNIEGQLRSGYGQVEGFGQGCVAFNLESHMSLEQPHRANTAIEVRNKLDTLLRGLYMNNMRLFDRKLKDARLDGLVLQMSCLTNIAESRLDMEVFTHSVYYSRSNLQVQEAIARFSWFRMSMQGPLGYPYV